MGYVPYFLNGLSKNVSEIMIVCNGKLDIAGKEKFGTIW